MQLRKEVVENEQLNLEHNVEQVRANLANCGLSKTADGKGGPS
jgi:hypothetical protein